MCTVSVQIEGVKISPRGSGFPLICLFLFLLRNRDAPFVSVS